MPIASEPTPSPRLWATAPGATPARLCEHTMRVASRPPKPELSTWLGIGTFYLAPTQLQTSRPRSITSVGSAEAHDRMNNLITECSSIAEQYHFQICSEPALLENWGESARTPDLPGYGWALPPS